GEHPAAPDLVGRIYRVGKAAGRTVAEVENAGASDATFTIERIKRAGALIGVQPNLTLLADDIILVVGRRAGVVNAAEAIGTELQSSEGMDIVVVTRDVTINSPAFIGKTVGEIKKAATADLRHGIY
ncbi:aspartate-alanine antiporter, partial [Klebsiella pneumoniae subsp. pneumoniae]|nr:aspartate-alanine antiporter [Klebsiella pneumoniae subsp. pneumoniae]